MGCISASVRHRREDLVRKHPRVSVDLFMWQLERNKMVLSEINGPDCLVCLNQSYSCPTGAAARRTEGGAEEKCQCSAAASEGQQGQSESEYNGIYCIMQKRKNKYNFTFCKSNSFMQIFLRDFNFKSH